MTSAAKRPIKDELNEAAARSAGLTLRSQAEEIDMRTMAMVVGTLMVSAGCATTGQVQPAAAAASDAPTASNAPAVVSEAKGARDPGEIRCERMASTGSRLGKSVCRTEEEWAAIERHADEIMDDIESKAMPYQDKGGG